MNSFLSRLAGLGRTKLLVIGGVAVVIVGVVVGIVVSGGSTPAKSTGSTTPSTSTPAVVAAPANPKICPLTDLPYPGGGDAPDRPALMVKIGNEPGPSRPQSGLNEADIVYDTPAEGFIMRYVAVFQCQNSSEIGPIRSVRWVDWHIAAQLGSPILAFAGGINPDVDTVEGLKWMKAADLLTNASSAGTRITSRVAPDNLYSSTSALYGLFKGDDAEPTTPFKFSTSFPASATPAASLAINFSYGTDVVWNWDAAAGQWMHTYSGTPDIDALTNKQVSTTNIVVQIVSYKLGPYCESGCPGGSGDVESNIVGNGEGYVLRDGKSIAVTWHHPNRIGPTTFTDAAGQPVDLEPGRTWVEIVPDTTAHAAGNLTITK